MVTEGGHRATDGGLVHYWARQGCTLLVGTLGKSASQTDHWWELQHVSGWRGAIVGRKVGRSHSLHQLLIICETDTHTHNTYGNTNITNTRACACACTY